MIGEGSFILVYVLKLSIYCSSLHPWGSLFSYLNLPLFLDSTGLKLIIEWWDYYCFDYIRDGILKFAFDFVIVLNYYKDASIDVVLPECISTRDN